MVHKKPKPCSPEGYEAYIPPRNIAETQHHEGSPTKVNDLYEGKFEKIDGKGPASGSGKLK